MASRQTATVHKVVNYSFLSNTLSLTSVTVLALLSAAFIIRLCGCINEDINNQYFQNERLISPLGINLLPEANTSRPVPHKNERGAKSIVTGALLVN